MSQSLNEIRGWGKVRKKTCGLCDSLTERDISTSAKYDSVVIMSLASIVDTAGNIFFVSWLYATREKRATLAVCSKINLCKKSTYSATFHFFLNSKFFCI